MSKKSTPAAPSDVPPDPSRLDLLETKLDKVLTAIGTVPSLQNLGDLCLQVLGRSSGPGLANGEYL